MNEITMVREQLSAAFLETYLRIQKLDEQLEHSPGTIVWKGPKKQYAYWQTYKNGRQSQRYIHKAGLEAVKSRIQTMKAQKEKRSILRRFLNDMKKALRAIKVRWQEVISVYEEAKARQEAEAVSRSAAKKAAENKRYADSYKHVTDKGDLVASKSEQLIANMLFARGIQYEYEKPLQIGSITFKPDFTVRSADGRIWIWEHAGLLDDPDYARRFREKLRMYEQAGIRLQENLIVTKDQNGAFDAEEVRRTIQFYRLA